jgi:hypothetical protein
MADDNNTRDNVVQFPETDAERRQLRKLQQDREKQKLVNVFIGSDDALFRDRRGEVYADLIINGHRETWPIKSLEFRGAYIAYLLRQLDRLIGEGSILAVGVKQAMSKNAINTAISDFEVRATSSTTTVRPVHVRVADYEGAIFIDLCNADWQVIRVTAAGWSIVESPPVRFVRADGMLPLPHPARGGNVAALRPFLNVKEDSDFTVLVGYTLAAMRPRAPYPILAAYGPPGAAKTTLLRRLRYFIDPSEVPTTPLPSSGEELFISARNSHFLAYENVGALSKMMSDHMCRMSTGGGYRGRRRFTNTRENLHRGGRPIGFEGIKNVIKQPDLQERAVVIEKERVEKYKSDEELELAFERARPRIFGALLNMLARGLRMRPSTTLKLPEPRMVDFALWAVACGVAGFEAAYARNRQDAVNVLLEHDPLARAVRAFMAGQQQWRGAAKDLLDAIGPAAEVDSTQAIADGLRYLAPNLLTVGLSVVSERRTGPQRPLRIEWVTPMTTPS